MPLKLRNPPLVEMVVGAQFTNLPGWTSAHPGWFWREYLGADWVTASDAPPLPDQFEAFGDKQRWVLPGLQFSMGSPVNRVQITNARGDRMVQLQSSRFHYNWQKREDVYPTYRTMRGEFEQLFAMFSKFTGDAKLGEISPNQWELTYVDRVPKGDLWQNPTAWHSIFPGILPNKASLGGSPLEQISEELHYIIEPARGRIHISIQSGRMAPGLGGEEMLLVQTTARGPVSAEPGWGLEEGLDLGHNAIIAAFLEMTSPEARNYWVVEET